MYRGRTINIESKPQRKKEKGKEKGKGKRKIIKQQKFKLT